MNHFGPVFGRPCFRTRQSIVLNDLYADIWAQALRRFSHRFIMPGERKRRRVKSSAKGDSTAGENVVMGTGSASAAAEDLVMVTGSASAAADAVVPVFPQVRCSTPGCTTVAKWSKMISTKELVHFQEKMSDEPDVVKYIYKCVVCVKKDKGIENDREAMTFIFEENGSLQYKRRQIEKCKVAQQRAVAFIEATGGTVKKPRVFKLGLSFMRDLFGGLAEMLAMKAKQYHIASLQLEGEGKAMLEKLKVSTDPVEIAKLIEWIEGKLLTDLEPLAFKGSRDHLNASAYDDTFAEFNGGHMRYFFICKAGKGYGEVCMILLSSKQWKQLFPDMPWRPGQHWYCLCCHSR
jgi:hypothetical protein